MIAGEEFRGGKSLVTVDHVTSGKRESMDLRQISNLWGTCKSIVNPDEVLVVTEAYNGKSSRYEIEAAVADEQATFQWLNPKPTVRGGSGEYVVLGLTPLRTVCANAAAQEIAQRDALIASLTAKLAEKDSKLHEAEAQARAAEATVSIAREQAKTAIELMSQQHRDVVNTLTGALSAQIDKLQAQVMLLSEKNKSLEIVIFQCEKNPK
jgi:hypothetical protein